MAVEFGCLERPLARFFHSYGGFVSRHPFPFIAFPLLLTLYLSTGFLHLSPMTDAVYLYTPTDAPSKTERQIIHDLWPLTDDNYVPGRAVTQSREAQITVVSRDGGNILLPEYARAIKRLDMYIQNRIKVHHRNRTFTYKELCLHWKTKGCPGNRHVEIVSELYNHGINITYPTFRVGSRSGYLGSALGGVSLSRGSDGQVMVAAARAWIMVYQLKFYPNNVSYVSGVWEKTFKAHMDNYPPDPYITITYFHSQTLAEELKRNADSLTPRFVTAFVILVIFSVICSMVTIKGTLYIDWVLSKPILSVLAVGTDNMFLMVASVKRTSRSLSVEERIGDCMADAAVSILITALTDAFSFGVGTITTIPAVQVFCIYTCCALVLTFLYQITFFCALLSLATKWEAEGRHCVWLRPTVPPKMHGTTSLLSRVLWMGSRTHPDPSHKTNSKNCTATRFFQNWYAPILMQPMIKVLAAVWYCIYVGFAIYGCTQLREGLEPVNLLVDDSYATPHYRSLEKHFWHYGATLQIVVSSAPDLRDPMERMKIKQMIHTFANTKHSIGDESIQCWLHEMERYYRLQMNTTVVDKSFYNMAAHYLYSQDDEPWMEDVKWASDGKGATYIKAFRFLIGMQDISSTLQQQAACANFREVAERYPEYNVTTFMPLWLFTDQYALVVPNTVQDIVIAVMCMLFIAFLLIPQPFCALWVAFTIGSIDLGVLGYMTLWGVNLDAISMITIIMSVGFSVDYSAHITYGYVISKDPDPRMRVRDALGDLGWPVVQGAASTILAVAVLADVPAYMIVTFFKTVFLAISIGLLHGLVFLPLMLSIFVRGCCTIGSRKEIDAHTVAINPSRIVPLRLETGRLPPPDHPPPKPPRTPKQSPRTRPNMSPSMRFMDGFDISPPSPPSMPPPPIPSSYPRSTMPHLPPLPPKLRRN